MNNSGFYNHELYIFSDQAKNISDKKQVNKVRKFLKTIKGFKKIKIFYSKKNLGTANNIINGVNKIIFKKKKVIILEDDLVLSNSFLQYMNKSLEKYQSNKKVWHISAWNYDLKIKNEYFDAFFSKHMMCWGWGTWHDRWKYFKKKPKLLIKNWKIDKIKKFNLNDSYNFWSQVLRNDKKIINTWAVFWYATIFEHNGLCLNPKNSLVLNLGNDNFAINTHKNSFNNKHILNKNFTVEKFPKKIAANEKIIKTIELSLKTNFFKKIAKKLKIYE